MIMTLNKFTCHEVGYIIQKLQESYSQIKNEDVPKYTLEIIQSMRARNICLLDVKVIVRSVITKDPEHVTALNLKNIDNYVESVYLEEI